ncbi:DUF1206 domain-containing protein [Cellulomonas sp. HZM]|uniref:DUF1206 domain-containing protein n=1 Tax=Cellulomonas sp. HZM TaxID=1454010 RepID=UPI0004932538|nr:DUF1206 domain-containing protein [Cellulomonas sp. HZM]
MSGTTTAQRGWQLAARSGYVTSGVLHVLIGVLAVRVALGSGGGHADQSGALATIARTPFGAIVLWASFVAFVALGTWQAAVALRKQPTSQGSGTGDRVQAAFRAVLYLALAVTSLSFALGSGRSSSKQTSDATQSLMSAPGGRILVGVVGVAVAVGGVVYAVKGLRRTFLEDLHGLPPGPAGAWSRRLGVVGYVAKGIALAIVGVLFVVAAAKHDPDKATGLDGALRTLRDAPAGTWLLVAAGAGFVAYGLYSFVRARYGRL